MRHVTRAARMAGVLLVCGAAAGGAGASALGCFGRECEGDWVDFWGEFDGVRASMIDANTFQTSPVEGRWLPFPHRRSFVIWFDKILATNEKMLGCARVDWVQLYVSADPVPTATNYAIAAGNVGQVFTLENDSHRAVGVHNATCADFYLRVVIHATPLGADTADEKCRQFATQPDASTDAPFGDASQDAGPGDATLD